MNRRDHVDEGDRALDGGRQMPLSHDPPPEPAGEDFQSLLDASSLGSPIVQEICSLSSEATREELFTRLEQDVGGNSRSDVDDAVLVLIQSSLTDPEFSVSGPSSSGSGKTELFDEELSLLAARGSTDPEDMLDLDLLSPYMTVYGDIARRHSSVTGLLRDLLEHQGLADVKEDVVEAVLQLPFRTDDRTPAVVWRACLEVVKEGRREEVDAYAWLGARLTPSKPAPTTRDGQGPEAPSWHRQGSSAGNDDSRHAVTGRTPGTRRDPEAEPESERRAPRQGNRRLTKTVVMTTLAAAIAVAIVSHSLHLKQTTQRGVAAASSGVPAASTRSPLAESSDGGDSKREFLSAVRRSLNARIRDTGDGPNPGAVRLWSEPDEDRGRVITSLREGTAVSALCRYLRGSQAREPSRSSGASRNSRTWYRVATSEESGWVPSLDVTRPGEVPTCEALIARTDAARDHLDASRNLQGGARRPLR